LRAFVQFLFADAFGGVWAGMKLEYVGQQALPANGWSRFLASFAF